MRTPVIVHTPISVGYQAPIPPGTHLVVGVRLGQVQPVDVLVEGLAVAAAVLLRLQDAADAPGLREQHTFS